MTTRLNISILDDLKARMDALGENINWSRIAAQAFERKLRDAQDLATPENLQELREVAENATSGGTIKDHILKLADRAGATPEMKQGIDRHIGPLVDRLLVTDPNAPEVTVELSDGVSDRDIAKAIAKAISDYDHQVVAPMRKRMFLEFILLQLHILNDRP